MPKSTLVDSNVLIDVWGSPSPTRIWSVDALVSCRAEGALVINPIVWSELAPSAADEASLKALLDRFGFEREPMSWRAAFAAGKAHSLYRRAGGPRERTLPDFLVGAHAASEGYRILTRDPARYRSYFPDVELVTPESFP